MSRYVMAIDPGKMSGWATFDRETREFESGQLDFDGLCAKMVGYASLHKQELVMVSESFLISAHTVKNTQAPWSLELIGVARYISRALTMLDLALQSPANAKHFSSDEKLVKLGWYVAGKGHANDASRHLLLLLVSRGWLPKDMLKELGT